MVVFEGELTGIAKKHYYKKAMMNFAGFFILCVAFLQPVVYIMYILLEDSFTDEVIFKTLSYTPSYIIIFTVIHAYKLLVNKPQKISINADYISVEMKKESLTRVASDVRKIYDYGDFYQIRVESSKMDRCFICQKSLVTKGDLELFKGLFRGKIEQKPNNVFLQFFGKK